MVARTAGKYQLRLAESRAALVYPRAAIRWAQRAVRAFQRAGNADRCLAAALDLLSTAHRSLGRLDLADTARRQQVAILDALAPGDIELVRALIDLGDLCRFRGQHNDAQKFLVRAVDTIGCSCREGDFAAKASALNALGIVYKDAGQYDKAADAYSQVLDLVLSFDGPEHANSASLWHNLAGLALARGRPEAAPLAARAVEIRQRVVGAHHHLVGQDLAVLGAVHLALDHVDDAEQALKRALAIFQTRHPIDRYEVAVNLSNLGICRFRRGDSAAAEGLLRRGLAIKRSVFGHEHPEIARQLNNLAVVLARRHRTAEAIELRHQALSIAERTLPAGHPITKVCRDALTTPTAAE
jgi:tetratricopeptide (TPR) repeat protein